MDSSRRGGLALRVIGGLLVLAAAGAIYQLAVTERSHETQDRLQAIVDREAAQLDVDLDRWAHLLATIDAIDAERLDQASFAEFVDEALGDRAVDGALTGTYSGMPTVLWIAAEPPVGVSAGETQPRFVVHFARPDFMTGPAIGFDVSGVAEVSEGLVRARDTGVPAVIGSFVAFTDLDPQAGDQSQVGSLSVPIYRDGVTPDTLVERRRQHVGWMVTGFLASDLLDGMLTDDRLVASLIVDNEIVTATAEIPAGRPSASAEVGAFGQDWSLVVTAVEPIVTGSWVNSAVAFASLAAAAAFALLVVVELLLRWRATDRRRIRAVEQQAVAWRNARQDLADQVAVGVMDLGADGTIRFVSSSINELIGRTAAEVTSRSVVELLGELAPEVDARELLARAGAPNEQAEVTINGRRLRVAAARVPEGGSMLTVVDVTSERAAIDALSEALDEAVEQREKGRRLIATMSHEVRTPLAGIVGLSSVALEETDPGLPVHDVLRQMQDVGADLLDIVNDALAISISDEGTLRLSPGPLDVRRFLSELLAYHRPNVAAGVHLHGRAEGVEVIHIDSSRLRQIVGNLVHNAIRHTTEGVVEVAIGRAASGALRIVVSDTGSGIPAESQGRVFEPFWQVDGTANRPGGAGLGLTVVRSLVDAMEGTVEMRSQEGAGTRFVVELPAADTDEPEPEADLAPSDTHATPALGLHVVVVDDDAISGEVASRQMARLGAEVDIIDEGPTALRAMDTTTVDVAVIDLHLPGVDGFAILAAALRRREATGSPRLVIAATASSAPQDHQRCRSMGVDAVMLKPIDREVIGGLISAAWPELATARLPNDSASPTLNEERIAELEELGVLDGVLELAAEQIPELRAQVDDHDPAIRANGAHRLAGTLLAIGADELADEANAVCAALATEPDAVLRARVDRLFDTAGALIDRLAADRQGVVAESSFD